MLDVHFIMFMALLIMLTWLIPHSYFSCQMCVSVYACGHSNQHIIQQIPEMRMRWLLLFPKITIQVPAINKLLLWYIVQVLHDALASYL